METELILSGGALPPFSARGCVQELQPVQQNRLKRTINGELAIVEKRPLKYRTVIRCDDKTTVALDTLQVGEDIRVGCIQRLWQKLGVGTEDIILDRPAVEGSVALINAAGTALPFELHDQHLKSLAIEQESFVSYRPWLWMKLINFRFTTNEWGLKVGWELVLEEV